MNTTHEHTFRTNNYIEVTFSLLPMSEIASDILTALLAPLGYDSFSSEEECVKAYCTADSFSAEALDALVAEFPLSDISLKWEAQEVANEDWNAEWEQSVSFEPIVIGNQICIHSPLATDIPACKYDIVIAPKMSFGSGHHETTRMMLEEIQDVQLLNSSNVPLLNSSNVPMFQCSHALDMGTGTGILAILCGKLGMDVRAIEIDPWVAENAVDNVLYNNMAGKVHVECGDATLLGDGQTYDLVLANINRNVLVGDMPAYVGDLNPDGLLILSGFYLEDLPIVRARAESLGLTYLSHRTQSNWVAARFKK